MFERTHHNRIASLLKLFDAAALNQAQCYFGGGTAIVLSLDEYRESLDIDFLCSSREGFRFLRNWVSSHSLGPLVKHDLKYRRDVRCERDKISTFVEVDEVPIKIEFILEGNLDLSGEMNEGLGIPLLSREDMFATKLLANADRGLDRSTLSRDIIDLAMMIQSWGEIPSSACDKAQAAYGEAVIKGLDNSYALIQNEVYLKSCLEKMKMESDLAVTIRDVLSEAKASGWSNCDRSKTDVPRF